METVNINDEEYLISFVDTEDTIKNMIALREDTFVKYIHFTVFKNLVEVTKKPAKKPIKVISTGSDIQVNILSDQLVGVPVEKLLDTISKLEKEWGIETNESISLSELAMEWLKVEKSGKVDEYDTKLLDSLKKINDTDFWNTEAIRNMYKWHIEGRVAEHKRLVKIVKIETAFRKEYAKYEPVDTTKFLQDSIIIEYQMITNLDPLEAFDSITLNATIPFVRLKMIDQVYYKIINAVIPQTNWLEGDATFTFKITRIGEKDDWSTATIQYTNNIAPYNLIMTIESTIKEGKGKKGSDEEKLKSTVLGIFIGAEINITSRREKGIKGIFAFPGVSISRDVFLDLVTNEPMISHYLYVDETRELSSQKGVLYLYYSSGQQVLTVFISERIVSRSDPFYQSKELALFTPYLNVRVSRAMNLDQINRFKQAFAVVMDIYEKKFEAIANIYNKVIPGFKIANTFQRKRVAKGKRLKELQAQDAELFIYGYPTKCEQKKQPIPIKQKDIKSWEKKKRQVMNYPKGSTNYFVCPDVTPTTKTDKISKYPGLKKNMLENNDKYEYLPCCYHVNQRVGTKQLNVYLKDIQKVGRISTTNIVTKKAIQSGKTGFLPRNIYHVLNKHTLEKGEFLRQGVPISKNSFIFAVLLALDKGYETVPDKVEYVKDFRNNLANQDITSVSQQMYDVDSQQVVKDILDPNIVFDSELFVGLLETYYDCQIVVFTRSDQQPNGEFEIPRYTQGYLFKKLVPGKKTVFIYKHMGIRSDHLEYPHYELIIRRYKKLKRIQWYFNDITLIRNIYSHFLRSYRLYLIGIGRYTPSTIPVHLLNLLESPEPPESLPEGNGQVIDHYGKTRGYVFGENIFMAVSPLFPTEGVISVDPPKERPSWKKVSTFITKYKLTIVAQDISNDTVIGVAIDLPGIPYTYIPFKPTIKLDGISEDKHLGFSVPTEEDILYHTVKNRKIADYLMQFMLYGFSLWYEDQINKPLYKKKIDKLKDQSLGLKKTNERAILMGMVNKYLERRLIIVSDHDYMVGGIPRRLTTNNSFFKNDKLIVDSDRSLSHLGNYFRFMINKNKPLVTQYSKQQVYLDNYYTASSDFRQQVGQLIFVGGLSISNWIESQEHGVSNQVHIVPQVNINEPYFFSHWAMNGGKPVIVQNVQHGNYQRALSVAAKYVTDGINVGYNASLIKQVPHTTYFFDQGILKRDGTNPIKVWRYSENFYAAILIP